MKLGSNILKINKAIQVIRDMEAARDQMFVQIARRNLTVCTLYIQVIPVALMISVVAFMKFTEDARK